MAWSHGTRWTDDLVRQHLVAMASRFGRMPTANELRAAGQNGLACAVSRLGGFRHWAEELGLERKQTETHWAQDWELHEKAWYETQGATVEKMTTRHPFDLFVNGWRVDVKASTYHRYRRGVERVDGYVFAGLKRGTTCDFFHLVCVDDRGAVVDRFVVPSSEARVQTLSITPRALAGRGKYSSFRMAVAPLLECNRRMAA